MLDAFDMKAYLAELLELVDAGCLEICPFTPVKNRSGAVLPLVTVFDPGP